MDSLHIGHTSVDCVSSEVRDDDESIDVSDTGESTRPGEGVGETDNDAFVSVVGIAVAGTARPVWAVVGVVDARGDDVAGSALFSAFLAVAWPRTRPWRCCKPVEAIECFSMRSLLQNRQAPVFYSFGC